MKYRHMINILSLACLLQTLIYNHVIAEDPVGHMQPLGSHMAPLEIEVRDMVPDPIDFFNNYVKLSKPVLFKGAAKKFKSFETWKSDEHLARKYGDWKVVAEIGKKEDREKGTEEMKFRKFLKIYKTSDLYLVEDIGPASPMAEEISLLKCLLCGGYTDHLKSIVMWFSSGGTKSVLHNDRLENINCLLDGTKELVMFDKKHQDRVPIDVPNGAYSSVDVEKVDLYKYSSLQGLPWYQAKMSTGDCLYIPFAWYHHVISSNTRNLAFNIWWDFMKRLSNVSDCQSAIPTLPDQMPLNRFKAADEHIGARSLLWEAFEVDQDAVSLEDFVNKLSKTIMEEKAAKVFSKEIDADKNGIVTVDEIENASPDLLMRYLAEDESEYNPGEEDVEFGDANEDNYQFPSQQEEGEETLFEDDEETKDEL